jgi:hypothetical protein
MWQCTNPLHSLSLPSPGTKARFKTEQVKATDPHYRKHRKNGIDYGGGCVTIADCAHHHSHLGRRERFGSIDVVMTISIRKDHFFSPS